MISLKLLAVAISLLVAEAAEITTETNQVKFPHHVRIGKCAGSIIDKSWVLTSKSCIAQNKESTIEITFERLFYGVNVFSLVVNNDVENVKNHPFSDISMIKLPVDLRFGEHLKSIDLFKTGKLKVEVNTIGVVPGFGSKPEKFAELQYGLFQLEPFVNEKCKKTSLIDEFTQVCTAPYYGFPGIPLCQEDIGSGLVLGWSKTPYLFGVLTQGTCSGKHEVYTKIEAFTPWIQTVMSTYSTKSLKQK